MKTLILAILIAALAGLLCVGVLLLRPSTSSASIEAPASGARTTGPGEALRASPVSSTALNSSGRRASEVLSGTAGTMLLVVDATTDEPIERYGISLRVCGELSRGSTRATSLEPTIKNVPGGALVVDLPLEGARFHVRAPGYFPLSGEIELPSEVDRRVFIRLDPAAVVRGRAVFEGEPVAGAKVYLYALDTRADDTSPGSRELLDSTETNEAGDFELRYFPVGGASLSIRGRTNRPPLILCDEGEVVSNRNARTRPRDGASKPLRHKRELDALKPPSEFELGDVELTMIGSEDIALDEDGRDGFYSPSSWVLNPLHPNNRMTRTARGSERLEPARILVQASDGGRVLANACVRLQLEAGGLSKEVGTTNDQGELLTQVTPGRANYIELLTPVGLPIGRSETAVFAASGEELVVPLRLNCGRLVIQIPSSFFPTASSALLLRIATDSQPEAVAIDLTLRDPSSALLQAGIEWAANRCVLPSLAPGDYTIDLDVMRKMRNTAQSSLLPTGLRFTGVARVTASAETICVLSAK